MNSTNGTGKNESGKIHMIISDGETRTYYCRSELYNKGFRFIRKDEKWHRDTTDPLFVEKEADKHKIIEKEVVREMTEEEKKDMVIRYIHDHSAQALELMTSAQNYKPEESKTPEEVESFETTNGEQS